MLSRVSLIKLSLPFMKVPPQDLTTFPKVPPPNTVTLAITWRGRGDTNVQAITVTITNRKIIAHAFQILLDSTKISL